MLHPENYQVSGSQIEMKKKKLFGTECDTHTHTQKKTTTVKFICRKGLRTFSVYMLHHTLPLLQPHQTMPSDEVAANPKAAGAKACRTLVHSHQKWW